MSGELIRLKCGVLHEGDEFFYHRARGNKTGWLRVRSVDALGRWVNGTDSDGRCRTIEVDAITTIRKPKLKPL